MRSRNHCGRRKAANITYSECMSVALIIQHTTKLLVAFRNFPKASITSSQLVLYREMMAVWAERGATEC